MATPQDIQTILSGDATFNNLMTGGIYTPDDADEISVAETPNVYDANGELKPCCYIRLETDIGSGPHYSSSEESVTIWFYQYRLHTVIDQAKDRAFTLLNNQRLASRGYKMQWADDLTHQRDETLNASFNMSRYRRAKVRQ